LRSSEIESLLCNLSYNSLVMVLFQCFSVAFVSFACLLFPAESQLPNFVLSMIISNFLAMYQTSFLSLSEFQLLLMVHYLSSLYVRCSAFVFSIKEVFYHDSTILVCSLLRIYEITNDVLYYDCFSPLGQKYRLEVLYDERYCGLFLEFS
jgi:hypothetical protein